LIKFLPSSVELHWVIGERSSKLVSVKDVIVVADAGLLNAKASKDVAYDDVESLVPP